MFTVLGNTGYPITLAGDGWPTSPRKFATPPLPDGTTEYTVDLLRRPHGRARAWLLLPDGTNVRYTHPLIR